MSKTMNVERVTVGDVLSFRGSGASRYMVRAITVNTVSVWLSLRDQSGRVLASEYKVGELAMVHS